MLDIPCEWGLKPYRESLAEAERRLSPQVGAKT